MKILSNNVNHNILFRFFFQKLDQQKSVWILQFFWKPILDTNIRMYPWFVFMILQIREKINHRRYSLVNVMHRYIYIIMSYVYWAAYVIEGCKNDDEFKPAWQSWSAVVCKSRLPNRRHRQYGKLFCDQFYQWPKLWTVFIYIY